MSNKKELKICEVCGDSALGVNFDAVCCESCKAFFRRNALKIKIVTCVYDGSCVIDLFKRRFCSYCRLQKCFKVGMKKDNILGESARKERMALVKLNREKRLKTNIDEVPMKKRKTKSEINLIDKIEADSTDIEGGVTLSMLNDITSNLTGGCGTSLDGDDSLTDVKLEAGRGGEDDDDDDDELEEEYGPRDDVEVTTATDVRRLLTNPMVNMMTEAALLQGTFDSKPLGPMGMPEGALTSIIAASLKSCVEAADATPPPPPRPHNESPIPHTTNIVEFTKYMNVGGDPKPTDESGDFRELSEFEQSTIQQLVDYYDLTFTVDLEPLIHLRQIDPSLSQLVNQASVTVLRIIKFAKRVEEFPHLPQMTQIVALKSAWMQILLLRSVSLYDVTRNVWVTPKGDIPTGILKNATGFNELHDSHVCYCKSFKELINDDLMIIVIIVVIVLFSAKGVQASSRRVISNIQDKYILLLKHYLECKYGYPQADRMMPELMVKIKELDTLADEHSAYLGGLNPRHVEPIMLEILNKE